MFLPFLRLLLVLSRSLKNSGTLFSSLRCELKEESCEGNNSFFHCANVNLLVHSRCVQGLISDNSFSVNVPGVNKIRCIVRNGYRCHKDSFSSLPTSPFQVHREASSACQPDLNCDISPNRNGEGRKRNNIRTEWIDCTDQGNVLMRKTRSPKEAECKVACTHDMQNVHT